jgi:hypothetical protein
LIDTQFAAAAGLRRLQDTVVDEIQSMPIETAGDVNDKVFGPWIRKGLPEQEAEN